MPYRGPVRLGAVSAVLVGAARGVLPLALCLIVVGGDSVGEAAPSATFFLPSGAQLLAVLLLAFGPVALCVPQAEAFMALVLGVAAACLGFCLLSGREVTVER